VQNNLEENDVLAMLMEQKRFNNIRKWNRKEKLHLSSVRGEQTKSEKEIRTQSKSRIKIKMIVRNKRD
jgi:hypothetical protein